MIYQDKLEKYFKKYFFYFIQILVLGASFFVINNNLTDNIDRSQYRFWMSQRSQLTQNMNPNIGQDITLIWVDEKFFNKEQISIQWLHRGYYARLINQLNQYNPRTITFDVFFEDEFKFSQVSQQDKILNRVFATYNDKLSENIDENIILAWIYDKAKQSFNAPWNIFQKNAGWVGHVNSTRDAEDNYVLWIPPIYTDNQNNNIPSLSLRSHINSYIQTQQQIFGQDVQLQYKLKNTKDTWHIQLPRKNINIPKNYTNHGRSYTMTLLYFQNVNNINYYSLYDILNDNYDPSLLQDQIIYIWATDEAYEDTVNTLVGTMPWVLVHINQHIALQNQDYIYILNYNQKIRLITIILVLNICILIYLKRKDSLSSLFGVLIVEIVFIYIISFLLSISSTYSIQYISTYMSYTN